MDGCRGIETSRREAVTDALVLGVYLGVSGGALGAFLLARGLELAERQLDKLLLRLKLLERLCITNANGVQAPLREHERNGLAGKEGFRSEDF